MDATSREPLAFDVQPRTRIVFGAGAVRRAGELARAAGMARVLLVTDPGIVAAGHAARVEAALRQAGVIVAIFTGVIENPTTATVAACVEAARAASIDGLVGLGGGSSLDTAKGCNFLLTNGGRMQDYWGTGKAARPMLPLLAIPTTAGTGSECQSYALISDAVTHQKMACGDPKAAPRVALLDPELTLTQPRRVTVCTGIDALAHSLETAVARVRTEWSLTWSRRAFGLLWRGLPEVLADPTDLAARGRVQLGAALAGLAIESSMLGAAHAAANPLTARHGVVHGEAVALMLPLVIRFNAGQPDARQEYVELARLAGLGGCAEAGDDPVANLVAALDGLLRTAGLPRTLEECGVSVADLPQLAAEAARQWTAGFNPRPVAAANFAALYEAARTGKGG